MRGNFDIDEPRAGSPLSSEWGRKVARAIRALQPVAGKGMRVSQTPQGTTYDSTPGSGNGSVRVENGEVMICRITGGDPSSGYMAEIYPTVADLRKGENGRTGRIYPVEIGLSAEIPVGTVVIGHRTCIQITGGSENG